MYFLNAGADPIPTPGLVSAASLMSASTGPKRDLSKQFMNLQWDVFVYHAEATLKVHEGLQIMVERVLENQGGKAEGQEESDQATDSLGVREWANRQRK